MQQQQLYLQTKSSLVFLRSTPCTYTSGVGAPSWWCWCPSLFSCGGLSAAVKPRNHQGIIVVYHIPSCCYRCQWLFFYNTIYVPFRLHYESSVTSESNPYSAFMNRGYENSCMDRPKSGEYNTIAEMMMYEDMKAPGGGTTDPQNPYLKPCDNRDMDTYFIPCTEHTESPYLKAIWSRDTLFKSWFYIGLF